MKTLMRYVIVAAAAAVAAPAVAAPLTPTERMHFEARERHESRDVQRNDFSTHGGLTAEQRDSYAAGKRERATQQSNQPLWAPALTGDRNAVY
ncbi:MAG: hypothetical protein AB1490_00565 [Pseudomonadota bacterium]